VSVLTRRDSNREVAMKKGGTTFISRPFIPRQFGVKGRFFI